jgi:hypothetical protein
MAKRTAEREFKKTDKRTEHLWIKYPRESPRNVTLRSGSNFCFQDDEKVGIEYKKHNGRAYNEIHNHPDLTNASFSDRVEYGGGELTASALPNSFELLSFAKNSQIRTMTVFQRDIITGEILGKTIVRKPKNYKFQSKDLSGLEKSEQKAQATGNTLDWRSEFEELVRNQGFQYRFIPNPDYELRAGNVAFTKKKSGYLERIAATILIFSLVGILLQFKMTGFAISEISIKSSALLSLIIIFLVSCLFLLYNLINKTKT